MKLLKSILLFVLVFILSEIGISQSVEKMTIWSNNKYAGSDFSETIVRDGEFLYGYMRFHHGVDTVFIGDHVLTRRPEQLPVDSSYNTSSVVVKMNEELEVLDFYEFWSRDKKLGFLITDLKLYDGKFYIKSYFDSTDEGLNYIYINDEYIDIHRDNDVWNGEVIIEFNKDFEYQRSWDYGGPFRNSDFAVRSDTLYYASSVSDDFEFNGYQVFEEGFEVDNPTLGLLMRYDMSEDTIIDHEIMIPTFPAQIDYCEIASLDFDKNGNIIIQVTYGTKLIWRGVEYDGFGSPVANDMLLISLNRDWSLRYAKTMSGPFGSLYLRKILYTEDGGIAIAYTMGGAYVYLGEEQILNIESEPLDWVPLFAKFSADGTLEWSKQFDPGTHFTDAYNIIEDGVGGYWCDIAFDPNRSYVIDDIEYEVVNEESENPFFKLVRLNENLEFKEVLSYQDKDNTVRAKFIDGYINDESKMIASFNGLGPYPTILDYTSPVKVTGHEILFTRISVDISSSVDDYFLSKSEPSFKIHSNIGVWDDMTIYFVEAQDISGQISIIGIDGRRIASTILSNGVQGQRLSELFDIKSIPDNMYYISWLDKTTKVSTLPIIVQN